MRRPIYLNVYLLQSMVSSNLNSYYRFRLFRYSELSITILDKSPLLICAIEGIGNDVVAEEDIITALLDGGPRCIPPQQLQLYKAQPFPKSIDSAEVTILYRAMWRVAKGKKLEAAIKVLKDEEWRYTREFLELTGKWGQLRSGAIVR